MPYFTSVEMLFAWHIGIWGSRRHNRLIMGRERGRKAVGYQEKRPGNPSVMGDVRGCPPDHVEKESSLDTHAPRM